jgi:hypothetical protein
MSSLVLILFRLETTLPDIPELEVTWVGFRIGTGASGDNLSTTP